ncbi:MAG TPA: hypothetical protein VG406_26910 [Isosphaeraceae bacterium]|nr:hypothetical protein [Isosphaeraceae bacterium]
MEHALGLGLLFWINGRRRWFWGGFEVAGLAAFGAFVLAWLSRASWFEVFLRSPVDWIEAHFRRPGQLLSDSEVFDTFLEYVFEPLLVFLPQVTLAVAGGAIANWLGTRVASGTEVEPARRKRTPVATALVFLAFFVMPAVGIEGFLRWAVDPGVSRMVHGTRAILRTQDGIGYFDPTSAPVATRSSRRKRDSGSWKIVSPRPSGSSRSTATARSSTGVLSSSKSSTAVRPGQRSGSPAAFYDRRGRSSEVARVFSDSLLAMGHFGR